MNLINQIQITGSSDTGKVRFGVRKRVERVMREDYKH